MARRITLAGCFLVLAWFTFAAVFAAVTVPPEIEQPGTQPLEIGNLESPNKCDNCHGGYDSAVEPAHNWRGSMMANAGRDPIFWATLAIAEQDFDGSGDLCLRCHSTSGWLEGRSTPTDGSALMARDADGVECDYCHKLTNPDDSEHQGVMNHPFLANEPNPVTGPGEGDARYDWDDPNGIEGYLGTGMSSLWGGGDKLGPYTPTAARHTYMLSLFHRDRDFCGTCHDVSNPAVGDLAHNHGAQAGAVANVDPGGGTPGDLVAFNNPPYRYGIVERTFSEYKASLIPLTEVDDYPGLPSRLKGGALQHIWQMATGNGAHSADYTNPAAPRYFSCQSCHMRPVTGKGANKPDAPVRTDLPLHDLTGGNYWMPEVIQYLDSQGKLRLGGGLTQAQRNAMDDGAQRARAQLSLAASLEVDAANNLVRVINHTGHKLISGYPEGRRMWLNIEWHDAADNKLREDGAYGRIRDAGGGLVRANGTPVESLLEPEDPNTRVYEAHMGMTRAWAQQLLNLGYDPNLVLDYDRTKTSAGSAALMTLGTFAAQMEVDVIETFHFVLNNAVVKDNRIPPYGMDYDTALDRNVLPVPASQYGGAPGGTYRYFDVVHLNPPPGATDAEIHLMYQPTSWEYIQFLWLANHGGNPFLANEGDYMLEAWLATGMAEPFEMAEAEWSGTAPDSCSGVNVLIQNRIFGGAAECIAENSLAANTNVRVPAGAVVRFVSPVTALGPGFSVEQGGMFSVSTGP